MFQTIYYVIKSNSQLLVCFILFQNIKICILMSENKNHFQVKACFIMIKNISNMQFIWHDIFFVKHSSRKDLCMRIQNHIYFLNSATWSIQTYVIVFTASWTITSLSTSIMHPRKPIGVKLIVIFSTTVSMYASILMNF